MRYDLIVLGGGLSGIASSIRFGHFGKRVLLLEKHNRLGGLNSTYERADIGIDVGLHAITGFNHTLAKSSPLKKVARYLRIDFDDLHIVSQNYSKIILSEISLKFGNSIDLLRESVYENFGSEIDNFDNLLADIVSYDDTTLSSVFVSARERLSFFIKDKRLIEALLIPILFYGSPLEMDINYLSFVIMFKAIFLEGFGRPEGGMRHVLSLLEKRLEDGSVDVRMSEAVTSIESKDGKVISILTNRGNRYEGDHVLSSLGRFETIMLSDELKESDKLANEKAKGLSFTESIYILDRKVSDLGEDASIVFYSSDEKFDYEIPDQLVDLRSGILCFPSNFAYKESADSKEFRSARITNLASYDLWSNLSKDEYRKQKWFYNNEKLSIFDRYSVSIREMVEFVDSFTPKTIKKFTSHIAGAVYGSKFKQFDGKSCLKNLHYIGTDQGYLGIVGSLLSGIMISNSILKESND